VLALPLVALVPLQAPEAAHEVALVLLQVRVLADPASKLEGVADRATVGTAGGGSGALWLP
jgi:hypothetical protein